MITIKDIAKKVGVAPSTVSRVLANKADFYTAETVAKVKTAARELGYKKNQSAADLVKQHSNVIAAVVSSVKTNFAGEIIEGIQKKAAEYGYKLIVVYSHSADPVEQKSALMTVIERPVMGVLLLSMALSDDNLKLLEEAQTPFCFLSMGFDDDRPFISSDDLAIGYQATKYLIDKGHRRIGFAGLDRYPNTGRLRLAGYQKALAEIGVTPEDHWVQSGDYSYESGLKAMQQYGAETNLTGVVAASDMVAIGVLNQAHLFKLSVPDDLSVIGIDGTEMCEIVQPQLTSISQDFYKMGVAGVERLRQLDLKQQAVKNKQEFVPTKLIERGSVTSAAE